MMARRIPVVTSVGLLVIVNAVVALMTSACDGDGSRPAPTPTAYAVPPPVSISPEPQGVELADPAFEALEGATADFGRLGGTVYRIEKPDTWNGALVLYIHGFRDFNPRTEAEFPAIRHYLIRKGFAWGTSSFSSTAQIPGRAADETAAVWDRFVSTYGRPERTYVYGESMGGLASLISAERYANRYDGALAMCPPAGQAAQAQSLSDFFTAGAFAAGVTQGDFVEFDRDVTGLINTHIVPALQDPERHRVFEDVFIALSGGPRPLDRRGIAVEEMANWNRAAIAIAARIAYNTDRAYSLEGDAAALEDDFIRQAVRVPPDPERIRAFVEGNEITGAIEIPVVTIHTTADMFVPISHDQELRRKVEAAGKGHLLAQFGVQAPGHCTFADSEHERGIEMLDAWVKEAVVPEGEDLLSGDLGNLGAEFTQIHRIGSAEAENVTGAGDRITLSGSVSVDGAPSNSSSLWVHVLSGGLWRSCTFAGVRPAGGRFERVAAASSELDGCGGPGTTYSFVTVREGKVYATAPQPWPAGDVAGLQVDLGAAAMGSALADFTRVSGAVLDRNGTRLPPGTIVDAYVGSTLCGSAAIPILKMDYGAPDEVSILVGGPALDEGCEAGGTITFRAGGRALDGSAANVLGGARLDVALTLEE